MSLVDPKLLHIFPLPIEFDWCKRLELPNCVKPLLLFAAIIIRLVWLFDRLDEDWELTELANCIIRLWADWELRIGTLFGPLLLVLKLLALNCCCNCCSWCCCCWNGEWLVRWRTGKSDGSKVENVESCWLETNLVEKIRYKIIK